jgi:CRISPR-associated protein Csd1
MILQALVKRYDDSAVSDKVVPFGWEVRNVKYAINISKEGELLDIVPLGDQKRGLAIELPQAAKRSSGIAPSFLCDNAQYFFGIFDEAKAEKDNKTEKRRSDAIKAFESSRSYHKQILDTAQGQNASAITKWFDCWKPELAISNEIISGMFADEKLKKVFLQTPFVFQVNGYFAQEDREIAEAWNRSLIDEDKGDADRDINKIRCLVSGNYDEIARLHGAIGLRGSQATAAFISVNSDSFASYGKTKDDPAASIGKQAEFKYRTALKNLLRDNNHHQFVGNDTIVYWAEDGGEAEAEMASLMVAPTENDTKKLDDLMEAITRGEMKKFDNFKLNRKFHILCLSPNKARISVRFFLTDTFGNVLRHIANHYDNLKIIASKNDRFPYLPPWILLSETTVSRKHGDVLPLLGRQLLDSIVTGKPYPMTFYNAILTRIRANEPINKTKAAIIKAVLIRNYEKEREVATVSLNPNSDNKPYALGRLFAVLEQLQKSASDGKLNATIRDGYFSRACANPRTVFPILLKLSMHHASKSAYKARYEKLKKELLDKLDVEEVPFPAALSYEDQGRFILGYYHQTQNPFISNKDREQGQKEEQTDV